MRVIGGALLLSSILLTGCNTTGTTPPPASPGVTKSPGRSIDTSGTFPKGFDRGEALRLLQLCLNLNNPDDGPDYAADTSAWEPVFPDTEAAHAEELGPWKNAWKLWRSRTEPQTYAIAIRGTTSDRVSIEEDVIATSVANPVRLQAWQDGSLTFRLGDQPGVETHLGFSYGLAVLMFARDKGILAQLAQVPAGSRIYITGHSQGAAVATLAHAFVHHAINDPDDRYGLANRGYSLKSYFFAQPKPGNWQFALNFARIATNRGVSYTINNPLDWVTQVPLTIQFADEPGANVAAQLEQTAREQGSGLPFQALKVALVVAQHSMRELQAKRAKVSAAIVAKSVKALQADAGLLDRRWMTPGTDMPERALSLNYVAAGDIIPVYSESPCPKLPSSGDAPDAMCQHHLPLYRRLIEAQLPP